MTRRTPLAALAVLAVTSLAACGGGDADPAAYPEDEITLVVPFSAGGPTDTVTRLIAEPMAEELGQQIVVQNVEGAGGTVAAGQVADEDGDGYNMLMHHIGMSTAPALYPDLEYSPLEDFKTIGLVTDVPMTIVARKDFEPETLEELVTYVEENADTVTLANAGVGAASQLCGLLIEQADRRRPHRGALRRHRPGADRPRRRPGRLHVRPDHQHRRRRSSPVTSRAYAVTTPEPVEALPDLPTTAEAGLPEVEVGVWHGLYVPAETPDEIVEKLTDGPGGRAGGPERHRPDGRPGHHPGGRGRRRRTPTRPSSRSRSTCWTPIIEEAGVTGE